LTQALHQVIDMFMRQYRGGPAISAEVINPHQSLQFPRWFAIENQQNATVLRLQIVEHAIDDGLALVDQADPVADLFDLR
jgi:hypothetical protein